MLDPDIFRHFAFVVLGDHPYRANAVAASNIIAQRLSMSYDVYYVQPPMGPKELFRIRKAEEEQPGDKTITEADYNLRVVTPPPFLLPGENRFRALNYANQHFFGRFLRDLLRKEEVQNFILWSFRFNSHEIMNVLRPDVAVYHATTRRSEEILPAPNKEILDDIEQLTIRSAHVAFTSSDLMYRQLIRIKPETFYAPPGVDYKLYHTVLRSDLALPGDLLAIPEPRVTYIGIIEHWIDLQLLDYLTAQMPDVSFVFIGKYGPWLNVDKMMSRPNVHFLGMRPRAALPAYLAGMHACLIPFKINPLTRHSHPMKIYEYLAAGKPVVSTPIHEVSRFNEFIEIAKSPRDFAERLRRAIADTDINRANARAEIARHYSWSHRIDEMLDVVARHLIGFDDRP